MLGTPWLQENPVPGGGDVPNYTWVGWRRHISAGWPLSIHQACLGLIHLRWVITVFSIERLSGCLSHHTNQETIRSLEIIYNCHILNCTYDGTRTRNHRLKRLMPYPLGHESNPHCGSETVIKTYGVHTSGYTNIQLRGWYVIYN